MANTSYTLGVKPSNAMPEIWSKVLLKNLSKVGVHKHIAVDHSSEFAANGDAIHLRRVDDSNITVGNYYTAGSGGAAGTQGTISAVDAQVVDNVLALTETPYVAVNFEDFALEQSDVKFQADIIERARLKIAEFIDDKIMSTIAATATAIDSQVFDATTASDGEMFDLLLQIAQKLKEAGAVSLNNASDLFGDKGLKQVPYVVVNPAVMRYILKEPAFVKIDMAGKDAMWKDGTVRGTIAGLVVLESTVMATTTNNVTIIGGVKDATHYAVKKISSRFVQSEDHFSTQWGTLFAMGCKVVLPGATVKQVVKVA